MIGDSNQPSHRQVHERKHRLHILLSYRPAVSRLSKRRQFSFRRLAPAQIQAARHDVQARRGLALGLSVGTFSRIPSFYERCRSKYLVHTIHPNLRAPVLLHPLALKKAWTGGSGQLLHLTEPKVEEFHRMRDVRGRILCM